MTKKPSEKNKAWEKDRRDRLNKSFDELAKLLPKFDKSIVWSKIEIIQKAITFIADLHKRLEDYLTAKDPELLKEYREFVNCLQFYQERNAQLTELLKKAKVTLPPPPVALPQLLVNKPELLPNQENVEVAQLQKPKKQRNRTKKDTADAVVDKKPDKVKEKKDSPAEDSPEKVESKPAKTEVVVKPTAIITAFGRETTLLHDVPKAATLQQLSPPPAVPAAKPLLLRIRKLRKHHQRLKLIPRPMFRKCYPHPSRMLKWNFDVVSNKKLPSIKQQKQQRGRRGRRRQITKRMLQIRKETPSKRLKVEFNPEPLREQSVSPTAAFLLSFPVVTSSMLGGKNVENTDSSVNLENLNNFFTTEEYSKFCDQNTVVGEKILSPLPVVVVAENEEKPLVNEKPMTVFTVSAITRPSAPKKIPENIASRVNGMTTTTTGYDNCFSFSGGNPMIGSTSMCGVSNSQQVTTKQYSVPNPVPTSIFPTLITSPAKLPIKQEQINHPTPGPVPSTSSSSEKFFPRYNHSNTNSLRNALQSPSKVLNSSQSITTQKDSSGQGNLPPPKTNWSVKSETPRGKSITNQISYSNGMKSLSSSPSSSLNNSKISSVATKTNQPKMPFLSPTKNFFYDFPTTQNRNLSSSSLSADPLISASTTATIKSNNSVKTEFPWIPPTNTSSTSTSNTCNQNTLFTPFDLATIVCDSLTSTNFTFSLATPKSSEPSVVDAGNKAAASNSRCNQMNLFLPYEEAQYTPTFSLPQTSRSTDTTQMVARESSWKSLEKPKDTTSADQIFYDCEQSKPQQKSHVNWMTSPTTDYTPTPTTTLPLPPMDFGNQFTGSSTNFDLSFVGCRKDSYDDDNQFINWSPTKPLNADFSTAYSFENFGSNEAPPNKTVKQIFSVSQLVDQTPSQDINTPLKKTMPKVVGEKSTTTAGVKQTFSNIYSAESLIAKKDNSRFYNAAEPSTNTQTTDYHNSNSYFFSYPNAQNCSENDYLGASAYSSSQQQQQTVKTNSIHPPAATGGGVGGIGGGGVNSTFDSTATTTNYFSHTISSNNNDPYDPTYFPSSNYNQSWNHATTSHTVGAVAASKAASSLNIFNNQGQFGTLQETSSCQQNVSNVSGNLTNFNLSSICPEIDGKDGPNEW